MDGVSKLIGSRIREFRKAQGITLQQLADMIHKSRASVSKYENGDIVLDVQTLYDVSAALRVPLSVLTDLSPFHQETPRPASGASGVSPFFQAERLYFYFYDGRYKRLKDGVIDIHKSSEPGASCEATLSIRAVTPSGLSSGIFYSGKVVYSDMLIRFSFVNR